MKRTGPIRTLIVDDSALIRSMLGRVLRDMTDIEVVGGAKDPFEARELIINYQPDVIILDIEMPRMDGLTFLKKLMEHYPVPVIMCSGSTRDNSRKALEAIELGAVDVVAKPKTGGSQALRALGEILAGKVRAAAEAMTVRPEIPASVKKQPTSFRATGLDPSRYLVAIGASTGGTEAVRSVLQNMPADAPPVVVVQHMPGGFTQSFADRLNQFSLLNVTQAADNEILLPGTAKVAQGGLQMRIRCSGNKCRIAYGETEPYNRHCPSVDVLFNSVAQQVGRMAVGIILTGMGADGAKGLLAMRNNGAATLAQSRQSCVVYGMPKVAVESGAVQMQCSPAEMPRHILQLLTQTSRKNAAISKAGV
jgi:two-component system chemotaxis response regulator CheB